MGANRPDMLLAFSRSVLQRTLFEVYRDVVAERDGVALAAVRTDADQRAFFEDAMNAVSATADYGAPMLFSLDHFEHRQATGLQITHAPGKNVVYAGSGLLILGIFMLFYVSQRRVWAMITPGEDGQHQLLVGGANQRRPEQFEQEFEDLADTVDQHLGQGGEHAPNDRG